MKTSEQLLAKHGVKPTHLRLLVLNELVKGEKSISALALSLHQIYSSIYSTVQSLVKADVLTANNSSYKATYRIKGE